MSLQHKAIPLLTAAGLWLAAAGGGLAAPANGAAQSPRQLIKHTADQVLARLQNERAELKAHPGKIYALVKNDILPHFDFERMSRWVLGRYWRRATAQQRSRFESEFRALLVNTYGNALLGYAGETIEYLPSEGDPASGEVLVRTRVHHPGTGSFPVDYRLHNKQGQWKVVDVSIDRLSLVTNYRESFADQMRQLGLDGLIARLAQHNKASAS